MLKIGMVQFGNYRPNESMSSHSPTIPLHHISHRPTLALTIKHWQQTDLETLTAEPPHRHDLNEIYLVTQGHSQQVIDDQQYNFSKNTLGLIAKGQIHNVLAMQDWEIWTIFFDDDVLAEPQIQALKHSLFNFRSPHQFHLSPMDLGLLEALLQSMEVVQDDHHNTYAKANLLQHYLCTILWHIERIKQQNNHGNGSHKLEHYKLCQTFLGQLETNFAKEHRVQFYANRLHISGRQLSEMTKTTLGKTAKELIEARLSLEARRLLRYSNTNIQTICYQLGFDDPSYFTRFFKRHNHLSPFDFRNSAS
ncbi:helix-turn-helix domain-containing protein [filamentous cyanobacterium LEGE 11480]|uniref:Helix-turn-helix domain-containing protein n=1 Tax=Romeriopsis navalis LEGE 11480 TaxID=2777977 RepID=A0A928VNS7_9CYAN|nr:helix-turn-helix domain-containing protein [Romeriopsis navalis]MBE9032008.1 helix-turn-helix domain-containing protein [Romeriopsis navalis LEGE 11480]